MCLVFAVSTVGNFAVPFPLWPWGPALDAIWITLVGASMLRRAAWLVESPATAISTPGGEQAASAGAMAAQS